MKVLIACELPSAARDELGGLGSEARYTPDLTPEALPAQMTGVGILVVGGLRVSAEAVNRNAGLQMIVHAGAGPGNIAVDEASAQGVFISHCPERNTHAVAELIFAFMLALDRQIVAQTEVLRSGRWARSEFLNARGLAGRTLGLLGCGRVGREVIRRARAFDMHVAVWSPTLTPERAAELGVEFCQWPRELARASQVVAVLAGAEAGPQHLVDAAFLEHLAPGSALIHVGHPSAVDEAAVIQAIDKRQLRVAIDSHNLAPAADTAKFKSRLLQAPGVIGTHHVAGYTEQSREAIAEEVVRVVRTFLVSGEVLNCLNLAERSPARWQLLLRVRDQVGVMASILDAIRADGINAEELSARVFSGARAAFILIALDERPSAEAVNAIRAIPDVLHLELRAMV